MVKKHYVYTGIKAIIIKIQESDFYMKLGSFFLCVKSDGVLQITYCAVIFMLKSFYE